ncbi:MAG: hypothetical protein HW387_751 [Parachlamydiales bacterium]|nr:hypothetical protein [Parachlamydiales bacterium]
MTIFEEIPALSPVQFFALLWDCPYLKGEWRATAERRIPSTAELLGEDEFADLYMAWNEQKIIVEVQVRHRSAGDSVELFFDTRDLKTKAHVSKFCHHFIFSPDEKEGFFGRELTRFRGEDIHRLADPKELITLPESDDHSYALRIEIPAVCLHGYDPIQFQRLGFTYRINRANLPSQHFAVTSEEFAIEQQPSLWATLKLVGKK